MHRLIAVTGLLIFVATGASAQPEPGPRELQGPQLLFYDAVAFPLDDDSTRIRVDIQYRIDKEFFIPVKNPDPLMGRPFRRRGEVLVELVDSTGRVAGRSSDRIEIGESDAERRPPGKEWRQGVLSITMRPGTYAVHFTVDDLESRRNFVDKGRTLRLSAPLGLTSASAMLVMPVTSDSSLPSTLVPMNFGGEVLFGRPSMMALIWPTVPADDSLISVTFTFTQIPPAGEDQQYLPLPREVTARVLRGVALKPAAESGAVMYVPGNGGAASIAIVPFPSERLLLRSYSLKIAASGRGATKEITRSFRTVWPDMPFSLKDIDYALEALKYITTEGELDSLRSGNLENRRKNLENFWRGKDQTRGTTYNEVQTEYYRRVDHAMRAFGTLRQLDGFRSDRGRIYVLYGPPSTTERSLSPVSGYQEVWFYEKLKKKFIFVDESKSGNYLLMTDTQ